MPSGLCTRLPVASFGAAQQLAKEIVRGEPDLVPPRLFTDTYCPQAGPLARAAIEAEVGRFFLPSTGRAVIPAL